MCRRITQPSSMVHLSTPIPPLPIPLQDITQREWRFPSALELRWERRGEEGGVGVAAGDTMTSTSTSTTTLTGTRTLAVATECRPVPRVGEGILGSTIRSTVAVHPIQTEQPRTSLEVRREAIPWRIAKQMPDSGNKVESAIALLAGLAIGAESATAVELEIIVAELGTEEATVQALGRATGARIAEEAGGTASETEVYRQEQTAVPGEVPLPDREAVPAAHVRAVREVRRAWAGEAVAVVAAVAGEGGNP